MKSFYFKVILFLLFLATSFLMAQNTSCEFAEPACPGGDFGQDIPTTSNGGSAESGPYYDCLYTQPNPLWYYIKIAEDGDVIFSLEQWSQPNQTGADYDVDFIVWGPFDGPTCGTDLSASMVVDCSYSATSFETINIPNAQQGEYYMILVTNWENLPGYITLEQTGGDGAFDCTILTEGDSYGYCDLDFDGQESFNLNTIATDIIDSGDPDWDITFYDNETNAEDEIGPILTSPFIAYTVDNPTNIYARIEENGSALEVRRLYLYVYPEPELTVFETEIELCDEDGNGEESFDLTSSEPDFVTNSGDWSFTYYTNVNDAHDASSNNINNPTVYVSGPDEIYVRIDAGVVQPGVDEGCYAIGVIHLILSDEISPQFEIENSYCLNMIPPTLPDVSDNGITGTWNPSVIDTSNEGTTTYEFNPDPGQCAISYELTIEITEGLAPEFNFENQYCLNSIPPSLPLISENGVEGTWNPATIDTSTPGIITYTFIPDEASCIADLEIPIEILEAPTLNPTGAIELCDTDFDGNYVTDLTELNDLVSNPNTGISFIYYATSSNMDNDIPIPSSQWGNYELDGMPNSIWIAAENAEGCRSEAIEIHFTEGQGISLLNDPYEIPFCNGEPVDLTDFAHIYTTETSVDINYYTTLINAQNDNNPITNTTNYTPASQGSVIYVRLEKADRCPEIIEVEFTAGEEAAHNEGPFDEIEFCLNDVRDLTEFEPDLSPTPGAVNFSYFESLSDAQNSTNSIIDPTEYIFPNANGNIYIRLEQQDRCVVILELPYQERPAPSLQVSNEETLCTGEEIEVTATSDYPDATFEWTSENGEILTGATQIFTDYGTYIVVVTGVDGCESAPQTISIIPPAPPTITNIESGNGTITVYASNGGNGAMEYSLDGILWQSNNQFNNLENGETYTVYVRSDGCVKTSYTITILDVPNFISPNGDGYNDEWTIRGIEVTPNATIKIFDRYGKIFVDTNFDGNYVWDGKYGGSPLPSGDYWFILNVPGDGVVVPQKHVGHVSVRNQ